MTGKKLIEAGMRQGPWFKDALPLANKMLSEGASLNDAIAAALKLQPEQLPLRKVGDVSYHLNIEAADEAEQENVNSVIQTMDALMRTPVVKAGAVMPDACPAGPVGTVPVGGVVASSEIHPGMHSADICCSMAITNFGKADPAKLLDAVHSVTHFGPGGRESQMRLPDWLKQKILKNPMTEKHSEISEWHFGTQGDGNHFAYVGTLASSGDTILVTHHGSRGFGARLYKDGMAIAERTRLQVSPETLKGNAWIKAESAEGETYWDALQVARLWTRENHYAIHDAAGAVLGANAEDRFWNEHNFVFRKSDGLFYHGKGATPAFDGWAEDATELTIIPLNMAEPILIVRGLNAENGLGFSPHGAGRNMSRSAHKRKNAGKPDAVIFAEETAEIDARFFCGETDISELPSAYKNASAVRAQIDQFALADVVDQVIPFGCIMAGDWEINAPWRKKARAKWAEKEQ
ncbi:MAG: RtcB family protein [Rhizobiaceae bacterium]|nr:RtcB family protein [Rhizobiaceae bacterium]